MIVPDFLAMPRPVHPGEFLREDILPLLGLDVVAAAQQAGLSSAYLQQLVHELVPVTAVTAFALGTLAGNSPQSWMLAQVAFDMWHAQHLDKAGRERMSQIL